MRSSSSDSVLFHDQVSISNTISGPQTPLHHLPISLPLTQSESILPPADTSPSPKPSADKLLLEALSPSISGGDITSTPAEAATSSPHAIVKQEVQHDDVTDTKTSSPSPTVAGNTAVKGLKPGLEDITDDEADVKPEPVEVKVEVKEEMELQRSPKVEVKTEPEDIADCSSFVDVKDEIKEEDISISKSSTSEEDATKSTDISRTSLLEEEGGRKGTRSVKVFKYCIYQLILLRLSPVVLILCVSTVFNS